MLKKNIQVIYFLEKNLVNKYLTFLKSNLSDNDEEKKLFNYLNNYWIKLRGIDSINYYNFIKKYKNKDGIKYLFIHDIIIKSFHAKLSKSLPKGKTT